MSLGKIVSALFDKTSAEDEDFMGIRVHLRELKKELLENSPDMEPDLKDYIETYADHWLLPHALEDEFDSFISETNDLVVELGNEGYFSNFRPNEDSEEL